MDIPAWFITTDDSGRLSSAQFSITTRTPGDRDSKVTTAIGHLGQTNDVGFHLVGNQFGGSTNYPNVIPGDGSLNKYPINDSGTGNPGPYGAWGLMESFWKRAITNGKTVQNVQITLGYGSGKLRPISFDVSFTINGTQFNIALPNKATARISNTILDQLRIATN